MVGARTVPEVPIDGRTWRLTMGLRPLDLADWLQVDLWRDADLTRKANLDQESRHLVEAFTSTSTEAGAELLAEVEANLALHHPELTPLSPQPHRHPTSQAALMVQEDLCVLEEQGGAYVLTSAHVAFPSRWSLTEKIGTTLSEIHAPVAGYAETLERPTTAFFHRLKVDQPMWRLNWTILDTDELHLPSPAARGATTWEGDPSELNFRTERQTLRRLPQTGAVVFSIKTSTEQLGALAERQPSLAAALHHTLVTAPATSVTYKGWTAILPGLLAWLDQVAATRG